MSVSLSRTLRLRDYESKKHEVTIHQEDYPEAARLQGDDLRRYLQYQAYRAIGSFEILEGVPAEEVQNRMQEIRRFLRIAEIMSRLPAEPPGPPGALPAENPAPAPGPDPARPANPPNPAPDQSPTPAPSATAALTPAEPPPLPPSRRGEYPDQVVAAAGHSVPEFGGMFPPSE